MAIYALIDQGMVRQLFETDGDITQMFHPSWVWVDVSGIEDIAEGWTATQVDGDWSFAAYVPPPPTSAELLAINSATLQHANQLAAAQKTALTNRIGVINDAIEFEEATPAEIAELPIRQAQLTAWKRYAVLLGRVTTQSGWHEVVDWPAQPAEGMDLSVSAVSGRASTVSAS